MFYVVVRPSLTKAPERVYIARYGADLRLDLAGRRSAIDWLTHQGCCPGAAAMLHDALPWQPYTIAEPTDLPCPAGALLDTT